MATYDSLSTGCPSPYRLQSSVAEDGSVSFRWKHLSAGIPIRLRYRLKGEPNWQDSVETSLQSLSLAGFQRCATYEWQAKTICSRPDASYSPIRTFVTAGCCESDVAELLPLSTSMRLSWTPYEGVMTYFLGYRPVGTANWQEEAFSNSSATLEGLDSCTMYEVRVGMDCPEVGLRWTDTVQVRTLGCGICQDLTYCSSVATNASFEWIEAIRIGDFESVSGSDNGYGNFAGTTIPILIDTPLQVSLKPGFLGSAFVERWRVWIDLNQDGRFDEAELVLSPNASQTTILDTLTIPAEQAPLQTLMRISMAWYGPAGDFTPKGCEDFVEGEVEDYCVALAKPTVVEPPLAIALYPNPIADPLFLESLMPFYPYLNRCQRARASC